MIELTLTVIWNVYVFSIACFSPMLDWKASFSNVGFCQSLDWIIFFSYTCISSQLIGKVFYVICCVQGLHWKEPLLYRFLVSIIELERLFRPNIDLNLVSENG
jgi:hypothetical protein